MNTPRTLVVLPPDESDGTDNIAHDGADTVKRFAEKNAISLSRAYKELAEGRLIARKVGGRTIITHEDAAAWRRALPKATFQDPSNIEKRNNNLPPWLLDKTPKQLTDERPPRRRGRPRKSQSNQDLSK